MPRREAVITFHVFSSWIGSQHSFEGNFLDQWFFYFKFGSVKSSDKTRWCFSQFLEHCCFFRTELLPFSTSQEKPSKRWLISHKYNLPRSCNKGSYWSQCQSNQNGLGVHYCELHSRFQEVNLLLFPGQSVDVLRQLIFQPWKTNHSFYIAGYVRYFVYCFSKRARVLWPKGRRTENTKVSQHFALRV